MDVSLTHSCGFDLQSGEFDSYSTHQERVMWQGTRVCFEGECPACGAELDPDEDTVFISG